MHKTNTQKDRFAEKRNSLRHTDSIHNLQAADDFGCSCRALNIELGIICSSLVHHILLRSQVQHLVAQIVINHIVFPPGSSSLSDEAKVISNDKGHHAKQTVSITKHQHFIKSTA